MAAGGSRAVASILLLLNLIMYAILAIISGWALNYGINETPRSVLGLTTPARIFPIYYPIGNLATGFFVIFSLVAALVGIAACLTGLHSTLNKNAAHISSAAASSIVAWALTILAMGLAWKEITLSSRTDALRAMETLTFILSFTQFLCAAALNLGLASAMQHIYSTGRM